MVDRDQVEVGSFYGSLGYEVRDLLVASRDLGPPAEPAGGRAEGVKVRQAVREDANDIQELLSMRGSRIELGGRARPPRRRGHAAP
ncbi:MAG TPA: hypothetical protein VIA06_12005 [Candidatus Dormibacteraeota bacterium]|jgi:hypothetical protein|nr:hypothetical protein [Candidatus Dormibacteraeota bacterium]